MIEAAADKSNGIGNAAKGDAAEGLSLSAETAGISPGTQDNILRTVAGDRGELS